MPLRSCYFSFNATATTEIYTLSLHEALPILNRLNRSGDLYLTHTRLDGRFTLRLCVGQTNTEQSQDRKSTRLNSSHPSISYAVFCLNKKTPSAAESITSKRSFFTSTINLPQT